MSRNVLLAAAGIFLLAAASANAADLLFSDEFNNLNNLMDVTGTSLTNEMVCSIVAAPGGKGGTCLEADAHGPTIGWDYMGNTLGDISIPTTGTITLKFSALKTMLDMTCTLGCWESRDGYSQPYSLLFMTAYNSPGLVYGKYNNGTTIPSPKWSGYSLGDWVTMAAVIDQDSTTANCNIYIANGLEVGVDDLWRTLDLNAASYPVNSFWFGTYWNSAYDGGDLKMYLDDIEVYSGDAITPPIPGDANCDGVVDEEDAARLAVNWLAGGADWSMGDFNDDHKVDDLDATIMATNWTAAASTSVPEPGAIAIMLGGLAVCFVCRRFGGKQ